MLETKRKRIRLFVRNIKSFFLRYTLESKKGKKWSLYEWIKITPSEQDILSG